MTRRLMSRRGNSANHSQVTPYQQIELDDGWREWENTKQELVLVKRQLAEKDALIVQLKTASRRLEETLRKKEKDLQAAFAILRSPQDAKTTKTRKQELIDRLVSECLQKAATSEALVEERRRELDKLKYSSKFLRFQELEIEIEECHTEIERLRAKLALTSASSPTAIVGKLKVSSVPLTPKDTVAITGTLSKKAKLDPLGVHEDISPDNRQNANASTNLSATRMPPVQTATGQVRVVPLAKYHQREGFVSKTRRRALEAEYYKQVRLAQLEVECELEENLHIRAAREAKRLHAVEQQDWQKETIVDSASSQHSTTETGTNSDKPTDDRDDLPQIEANSGKPDTASQEVGENEHTSVDSIDKEVDIATRAPVEHSAGNTAQAESVETTVTVESAENQVETTEEGNGNGEASEELQNVQKTYEDDEFDDNDDNSKETGPGGEYNGWNVDPYPQNGHQSDSIEKKDAELSQQPDDSDDGNSKSAIWNADPNPPASPEADIPSEAEADRVVWNADHHPGGSDEPMDDVSVVNSDEGHAYDDSKEYDGKHDEISKDTRSVGEYNAWNVDPNSQSDRLTDSKNTDLNQQAGNNEADVDRVVWNADPHADGSDAVKTDASVVNSDEEDLAQDDSVEHEDPIPKKDNPASNAWNLDPSPPVPTDANLADSVASYEAEEQSPNVIDTNTDVNVWNVNPIPASDPTHTAENMTEAIDGGRPAVADQPGWNIDPDPAAAAASNPEVPAPHKDTTDDYRAELVENNPDDSNAIVGSNPSDSAPDEENDENPWNLDPTLAPSITEDKGDNEDPLQNGELPLSGAAELSSRVGSAQGDSDHGAVDLEEDTNNAWNLDPTAPTAVLMPDVDGSNSPSGEEVIERNVWNLDPHTGDASEATDTFNEATGLETTQEDEVAPIPPTVADALPAGAGEEGPTPIYQETPDESSNDPDTPVIDGDADMTAASEPNSEASYHSSPRELEDDATPEYTPPSTERDSDADDD
ncbi:hypothetical protein L915_15277 [Phytophthora nicotianae]|uniref:Uncharacterized protein n=1 Tax=Phytophthora nicotianae TaxID=4792 RepID=W2G6W2_PHYNI|nr:hypothetical protein L915_15277 [Phytophthora nicotianae]